MDAAALLPELIRAAASGPWAVVDRVAAALEPLGFATRRLEGESGAALFTRTGAGNAPGQAGEPPRLCFSGHVDVVPVGVGWTRDAFGGETADGRIWGRGACDMLGSVACFVEAAALVPDAPLAVLLTTDEETRMHGAERALDEGLLVGVERVVVGEPTHHAVGVAEKGVLWMRVRTRGRNAHGSMPELGDNAAERLLRVMPGILHALGERLATGDAHALLGRATRNLGQMHGGEAVNQVPAEAHADLDVRYLPSHRADDLLQDVRDAIERAGERADVNVISSHVPFEAAPDSPFATRAVDAVRAAGRPDARAIGLPYGTEASKFAPAGLDTLILGPGEPGLAHTNVESIALDDLRIGAQTYARLLRAEGAEPRR